MNFWPLTFHPSFCLGFAMLQLDSNHIILRQLLQSTLLLCWWQPLSLSGCVLIIIYHHKIKMCQCDGQASPCVLCENGGYLDDHCSTHSLHPRHYYHCNWNCGWCWRHQSSWKRKVCKQFSFNPFPHISFCRKLEIKGMAFFQTLVWLSNRKWRNFLKWQV